ncbi:prepilin-type N-terminal cleavage/methylation domain-containing protein [Desulfonatronospira thiodismutans]|nr:prepilin-type N-terminal cleavage/methylation domain-containing protein [Desulfonatronospira thiodismutans]
MYSPNHNQNAFTLIEILLIITIIGLLTAIAIPWYASYRDSTRKATIIHDLRICLSETAVDIHNGDAPSPCHIGANANYDKNPFADEAGMLSPSPDFEVAGYFFEFDGRRIHTLE